LFSEMQLKKLADFRGGETFLPPEEYSWAVTTFDLVANGARIKSYGHPLLNFLDLAIRNTMDLMREGLLVRGRSLSPRQVIVFFLNAKHSREVNIHADDNLIDTIGYAQCYQLIDTAMFNLGLGGMSWFEGKSLTDLIALFEQLT